MCRRDYYSITTASSLAIWTHSAERLSKMSLHKKKADEMDKMLDGCFCLSQMEQVRYGLKYIMDECNRCPCSPCSLEDENGRVLNALLFTLPTSQFKTSVEIKIF